MLAMLALFDWAQGVETKGIGDTSTLTDDPLEGRSLPNQIPFHDPRCLRDRIFCSITQKNRVLLGLKSRVISLSNYNTYYVLLCM